MKKIIFLIAALSVCFFGRSNACTHCDSSFNFGFSGSVGLTRFDSVYQNDGQSVLGRLSLNSQYALSDFLALGIDLGVQNGNTMRLSISKETLDLLGGEPVSINVKPMVDLLLTAQIIPFEDGGFFGFVKGGLAYRQAQVDRNEVNDLSKFSPELQAGFGYKINDNLAIHLAFQQVFGGNPDYKVNPITERATITNIPSQKAVLLGLSLII
ncbi:MAG: outer membrane beta-barrel protein [Tatlockia sp.]|nr:outer membrane beta-barrel protein [Tatlockia sp.]